MTGKPVFPNSAHRLALVSWCLGLALCPLISRDMAAQESGSSGEWPTVKVDGLVLEHQKYSFTLRGLDQDYQISIPNGTPILMKLTWPELDFAKKELSVRLLVTAADGDLRNNTRLHYPIPDPLYFSAEFESKEELDRALQQPVVSPGKFILSGEPPPSVANSLQGRLFPGHSVNEYRLDTGVSIIPIKLDPRKGLMANLKITDLRPHETEVFAEGRYENGVLVAHSIRFQPIGDPFAAFDPELPNALVIGDQISIGYDPLLRKALAGKMNVHHPPCNCGGAENWRDIHRWLSNPDGDRRRWDVIAFNFGLQDVSASENVWKTDLRNAIRTLSKTNARLVWITSTPIPRGFEKPYAGNRPQGLVQGRTELQNQWAKEVLAEFPSVSVCDLENLVSSNPDGIYDEWWQGKSATFNGNQSRPLAEAVAQCLMETAAQTSLR